MPSLSTLLHQLQDLPFATAIREGDTLFPWIECVHVLAVTIVVGSIAAVDLRLLGVASRNRVFSRLSAEVLPLTWGAFGVALLSGGLLFSSKAVQYAANAAFDVKLGLLLLAGLNMAAFQLLTARAIGAWDAGLRLPLRARLAGLASLVLWTGVIVCGRIIGFTMTDLGS